MPTVVLLDVSLSMMRNVQDSDQQESTVNRRHLAIRGLYSFFDYLSENCRLEFTALIAFSSLWEIVVRFTRDYDALKEGCLNVDTYDKTFIGNALNGVSNLVIEEWGCSVPVQVILVTDGNLGGATTIDEILTNRLGENAENACTLPLPFPCIMHIVCVAPLEDTSSINLKLMQDLCDVCGTGGGVFMLDAPASIHSAQEAFNRLTHEHYTSYTGSLTCGHLKSTITLYPPPQQSFKNAAMSSSSVKEDQPFPSEIKICGFLDASDMGNPPCVTRHLVIPTGSAMNDTKTGTSSGVDGKSPSFCVLLHGSLKVEKMIAFAQLGPNWFGMLYSWADSKKKSNLVLSVFPCGVDISWLGNLKRLTPAAEMENNPYKPDSQSGESPFPVETSRRRSYHSQASVVWVKSSGLQADIQKLMRYARKLPDKINQFYKELNRIRRAALCYSYFDLLDGIADLLEKEIDSYNTDATMQLQHAATSMREAGQHDLNKLITTAQVS